LHTAREQSASEEGRHCFLCSPSAELVFLESENFYALAGLGPVVDGYCVVAAKSHVKSMADVPLGQAGERDAFITLVRNRLIAMYGTCLITEHGRMTVCADEHDHHCFHAHFLVFPGTEDVSALADSYFSTSQAFTNLETSLAHGALHAEYLLISPSPTRFSIYSTPLNAPRQLARHLVAWKTGNGHLADWKTWPQRDRAIFIAETLRSAFASEDNGNRS
jgi:diadenosine tetraphosphate (Ap4A) HIT family hydrolase